MSVQVVACDPALQAPVVAVGFSPYHENTAEFQVVNASAFASNSTYQWSFGDGQSGQSTTPFITHFYGDALDSNQLYSTFQVALTVQQSGLADRTAHKTVTVWNGYAFNKRRGFLQPPVVSSGRLQVSGGQYSGSYAITNLEDASLQLTTRVLEYQFCDPDRESATQPAESVALTIGARQTVDEQLTLSAGALGADICGVAVTRIGQGPQGSPVITSAYFDVRSNPLMQHGVTDPALQQMLNDVVARGLVSDPMHITDEDLHRLERERLITRPLPAAAVAVSRAAVAAAPRQGPADPVLGQPCVPSDTPPRPGVTCQTTGAWTVAPPRIANAHKGDIILSSVCGMIGGLLRQVSPPQRYSHSGMMVRDYYEIRHSTASTDRYGDYGVGLFDGSDGVREDVLRYGWPGVISQSVDEAYNGQNLIDPENGKLYTVEGFGADPVRCADDIAVTYPTVIKPVPGTDPSVRARLRQAADIAKTIGGHYRFYSYSNAAIANDRTRDAPAYAGWAAGTRGVVCSSFIWNALKQAGIDLEGLQIEPQDAALGAERDATTADGLYYYTEAERRAGAGWLYAHMYDLAYAKAGWLGRLFTDAPDDFANQMTNCFASDNCGERDEASWQNPGVGRAVSPDNIFFWDAPATGGVYGYSEPLVYRSGEYVPVTVWQASAGVGTIAGRVFVNGQPVPNASVSVAGLELFTDSAGAFRDELIPAGRYDVVGSATINGLYLSTHADVTITAGGTTNVDLVLQPPPNYYRRVTINGTISALDDESCIFTNCDEKGSTTIFESRALDPFNRRVDFSLQPFCVGGEVRVEVDYHLRLTDDNTTVEVSGEARLYEGTSCDTDDHEDTKAFLFSVPLDQTSAPQHVHLYNDEFDGGDYADIDFSVVNGPQALTTASAIGQEGGTLQAAATGVTVSVPAQSVSQLTTIQYSWKPGPAHGLGIARQAIQSFALDARGATGTALRAAARPYTIAVSYSDSQLAALGVTAESLRLAYWDGSAWQELHSCHGCGVDTRAKRVTAQADQFTEFALIGDNAHKVYLPLVRR